MPYPLYPTPYTLTQEHLSEALFETIIDVPGKVFEVKHFLQT